LKKVSFIAINCNFWVAALFKLIGRGVFGEVPPRNFYLLYYLVNVMVVIGLFRNDFLAPLNTKRFSFE